MIIINIGNSYSRVTGLTASEFGKLRKLLSYRVETYGLTSPRYLIYKRGNFPTGLLPSVKKFVIDLKRPYSLKDTRNKLGHARVPLSLKKRVEPYPWQLKAATIASKYSRAGIVAATGTGKSLAMALIIDELKLRTLIVVPNIEIRRQLHSSFIALFGWNYDRYITILNIDSPALRQADHYDMLIIDECHRAAAKTYRMLNKKYWNGIYRRYFFSATFFRNDNNEQLLFEGVCGQIKYELPYRAAVTDGYIVPVDAYYFKLEKRPVEGYTWAQVYKELVTKNTGRNALIARTLEMLKENGRSSLCLVKEVAHGESLSAISNIPFANGQDESSRDYIKQFNSGKIPCLIATTGILGEGVDTKPCEYVIIAGLGKAKSAFMQQIGRAVRKYPGKESAKVILFKDTSHKWTRKHFNAQAKILREEYGVKPIEI